MTFALLFAQLPLLVQPAVTEPPDSGQQQHKLGIEITYLANEGFLLRSGPYEILIDAFVAEPYSGYAALSPEMLQKLMSAAPPFDGAKIMALTSHAHRDHFQPETAERFLLRSSTATFVSSPQVVGVLAKSSQDYQKIKDLVRAIPVKPGEIQAIPGPEVTIQFMNFQHGGEKNKKIQNYGHLITMGGLKVLHVGDPDPDEELFAPYDLAKRNIDVAFVPYWFFSSEEGVRIIDEQFHANYLIVCHIPLDEQADIVARLHKDNPHVLVFDKPGDKKVFRAEEPTGTQETGNEDG